MVRFKWNVVLRTEWSLRLTNSEQHCRLGSKPGSTDLTHRNERVFRGQRNRAIIKNLSLILLQDNSYRLVVNATQKEQTQSSFTCGILYEICCERNIVYFTSGNIPYFVSQRINLAKTEKRSFMIKYTNI